MMPLKFIWTFSDLCAAFAVSLFIIGVIIIFFKGWIDSIKERRNKKSGKD